MDVFHMSYFQRLILTLAIIFTSVAAGYACRRLSEKGALGIPLAVLDIWRKRLQTIAIIALMPFSAMLSLWGLPMPKPQLIALPMLGLCSYIWGGALALAGARLLKLSRRQAGSFYCCGTFTNIAAAGGLACLLFFGENSIALVALYRFLEEIFYFSIAFPVAEWFGHDNKSVKLNFQSFTFRPVLVIILLALFLGIALNLLHVPRPDSFGLAASASMLAATVTLLFGIGLTLKFSALGNYLADSLLMCAIKFLAVPAVIVLLAKAIGYGQIENGLPLKVAVTLSCMPVAMTALVPPSLFSLDVDLANACWIFSTLCLIIVLPVLIFFLPIL